MTATQTRMGSETVESRDAQAMEADLAWFLATSAEAQPHTMGGTPPNDDRVAAIVATGLLGLPSAAIEEGVDRAMAVAGRQRGVERVFYYRLDRAAGQLHLTHEWFTDGLSAMKGKPEYARVPASVLPPAL